MSAYTMLAEQSPLDASAFTTADTTTSFDTNPTFPEDILGLGFNADDEPVWNMGPLSESFSGWNPKIDNTFSNVNLDRDIKYTQVRNGQPTPPLDDSKLSPQTTFMTTFSRNAWDDTPTPPSSEDRMVNASMMGYADASVGSSRRKLRGSKHSIATVSSTGDSDDDGQDRSKREKFLERNRLAASKCRQKKKEHTMQLEKRFRDQSKKRERLNSEISQLRSEILELKNEVLRHAQCGDEPIKLHLAQMVKQIAHKDRREPTDGSDSLPEALPSPSVRASVSFGFDEPMPLDGAASLEQQIRRDSEASIAMSVDDDFNNLINVN
ncbi:putative bZIP transcription factor [Talaromyces proteolyticus]|uniref:BZIP transcription factor n=1 Tax=Talaromyces proteolyticus TaxID=1131652 RepID=A0AAD4L0M5_9EURO|nr:putative bZIP transcription factor [Talaromyces proteolyticus]KAH8705393.1 putative bZIP transcription factor [Talaromyces proteolyticus]